MYCQAYNHAFTKADEIEDRSIPVSFHLCFMHTFPPMWVQSWCGLEPQLPRPHPHGWPGSHTANRRCSARDSGYHEVHKKQEVSGSVLPLVTMVSRKPFLPAMVCSDIDLSLPKSVQQFLAGHRVPLLVLERPGLAIPLKLSR